MAEHTKRRRSRRARWSLNTPYWVFGFVALLLAVSPWIRGGNRQVALSLMLAIALVILALVFSHTSVQALSRVQQVHSAPEPVWKHVVVLLLGTSPLWIGGLQLVPLPADWWATLPGRHAYLLALDAAHIDASPTLPLSLTPDATWASVWAAVPVCAAFLAAVWVVPAERVYTLVKLLLVLGGLQALLGLLQFASGGVQSPLMFGGTGGNMIGSFANRNSLGDFLAMMLPLWFVVLLHQERRAKSKRLADGSAMTGFFRPAWFLFGFVLLVVVVSTQSRGANLAALVVLLLSLGVYMGTKSSHDVSRKTKWGIALLMLLFAVAAFVVAGTDKLTNRIETGQVVMDAHTRTVYALSTVQAGMALWPWGSGLGTFSAVFPRFQDVQSLGFVNEAHNDYVQLFMELGALGVAVALMLLLLVLHQSLQLVKLTRSERRLSTATATQWLAGCAALALMLHSWVDFNMRIPSLALTAALLAGVFLRAPSAHADHVSPRY